MTFDRSLVPALQVLPDVRPAVAEGRLPAGPLTVEVWARVNAAYLPYAALVSAETPGVAGWAVASPRHQANRGFGGAE